MSNINSPVNWLAVLRGSKCLSLFPWALLLFLSCAAYAEPRPVHFTIPAQALDSALIEFAEQADMDIVGLSSRLSQLTSPEVDGEMTRTQALDRLLSGTNLRYHISRQRAVTITEQKVVSVQPVSVNPAKAETLSLLEEVTVSATRRNTNLQNTPIAITAVNQFTLERNQARDLRDITQIVPGLEMVNTGPQVAILAQLRGVGTTNITEIADGPVAIHIDGVYSPRSQGAAALLYDVDRVEVLRGPQGTLFGRNSASGSINVYNRKPEMDISSAALSLSYGNYNHKGFRGSVNIPVNSNLSLRVAAASNRHDAYTQLIDNYLGYGPHYPASVDELGDFNQALDLGQTGPESADQRSWRVSMQWLLTDNLTALLSAERYTDQSTGIAELDPTLVEQGIRAVVFDSPSFLDLSNDSIRGRLEYRFSDGYSLSYILGLSEMSREQIFDADNGFDGSFEQQRTDSSNFNFYSHEIQLINSDQHRLKWVLGAFSSQEKNEIVFAVDQQNAGGDRSAQGASSWISDHGGAAVSYAVQPDRRVKSLGVFAQAAYDVSTQSRFTVGLRYTKDTKSDRGGRALNCRVTSVLGPYTEAGSIGPGAPDATDIYADTGAAAAIQAGLPYDNGTNTGIVDQACWVRQVNDFSASWRNTSGLVRYDRDMDDNVMLYASVATGFKSGHIQDAGNKAAPETVINYELGVKSQRLNDKLRANAALYWAEYDDLQFSNDDRLDINGDGVADTGGSTVVRNASEATVKGVELELEWALSANDHIQLVGTLMDARFDKFEIPDTLFGNVFNPYVSAQSGSPTDPVVLSGNSPPRTPDWKFTLVYEHVFSVSDLTITPRLLATYSDKYFLDIYNRSDLDAGVFPGLPDGGRDLGVQKAYQMYDMSLRVSPESKQWLIEAYVKNLTDENVKISSGHFITENGFAATYMPPRTYGVTFSYLFSNE